MVSFSLNASAPVDFMVSRARMFASLLYKLPISFCASPCGAARQSLASFRLPELVAHPLERFYARMLTLADVAAAAPFSLSGPTYATRFS